MGQKVHPYGIRLGIIKDWTSTWFADRRRYPDYLNTDLAVRAFLRKKLAHASVSRIQIERPANNARIIIHTARPGIVIGKKGEDIESLRKQVSKLMGISAHLSVEEIRKPELDAYLVAESVAQQLERRIMFRPATLILMPWAPNRSAFATARFIARRNMMRRSSCCATDSATR